MSTSPVVVHVGPDPAGPTVGGIASVIGTLVETAPYPCSVIASYWSRRRPYLGRLSRSLVAVWRVPPGAVVHVHMSEAGSWFREGAFVQVARWSGKGVALTLHGAEFGQWVLRPGARRWVGAVLRRADVVFTLQDSDARLVSTSTTPVLTVCNPVVAGPGPAPSEARTGDEESTVVFLGEQSYRKGVDVLTAAWPQVLARHPEARLVAAGPSAADHAPVSGPKVHNLGTLSPDDARRLLRGATLAVLPSRAEALPMVLLEAMADGVPFIASDVGGIPVLAASGAGLLVPPGDVETLAAAIISVLADPVLRADMCEAGRGWWGAHGTPAAVHEALCLGYRLAVPDGAGSAAQGGGPLRLSARVRRLRDRTRSTRRAPGAPLG